MELRVLDTNLEVLHIIDAYESLIWKDCYNKCGDFELLMRFDAETYSLVTNDTYLKFADSDHLMVVEYHEITTDIEDGMHLLIKGRSLEALLDRRIVVKRTMLTGNFQTGIQKLLNENAISPTDTNRQIPNLVFKASTDASITALTVESQITCDNLYTLIQAMCAERKLGFEIVPNSSNKLEFTLYKGMDLSYSQNVNNFVVFAPEYDNLLNSKYTESTASLRNVAVVGGEGEGRLRKFYTVGSGVGLARRELFVDAKDISSTAEVEGGTNLTLAQYNAQLSQRGTEKLAENVITTTVEAEADTTMTFVYNQDFYLGDIVQLSNELGIGSAVRIGEVLFSDDTSKYTIIPTFEVV